MSPIPPVVSVGGVPGIAGALPAGATSPVTGPSGVSGPGAVNAQAFADLLAGAKAEPAGITSHLSGVFAKGLGEVQRTTSAADALAVKAATGDLTDAHDYTIAATQAKLTTEITVALRNKAVEAFNEIMRIQA